MDTGFQRTKKMVGVRGEPISYSQRLNFNNFTSRYVFLCVVHSVVQLLFMRLAKYSAHSAKVKWLFLGIQKLAFPLNFFFQFIFTGEMEQIF